MSRNVSSSDDIIDIRDVIARVEELREERDALDEAITYAKDTYTDTNNDPDATGLVIGTTAEALADAHEERENWNDEEGAELKTLESLLKELAGYGGDEQWEGEWYPISLIRDSYFTEAMQELVSDIIDLPRDIPGYLVIDWDATASNLQVDYSSVEFEGTTYWYR